MKEELRRPRFSSAYYTRNVGVEIEGHAALVVDDNESRIERSARHRPRQIPPRP
jgi:hypothetical protein